MNPIIAEITKDQLKSHDFSFKTGDRVKVHLNIREGSKQRVQTFTGIVMARSGGNGISATFTVIRKSLGVFVERVFPLHSPNIEKIEVEARGKVTRAKLMHLRDRLDQKAFKVIEAKAK